MIGTAVSCWVIGIHIGEAKCEGVVLSVGSAWRLARDSPKPEFRDQPRAQRNASMCP